MWLDISREGAKPRREMRSLPFKCAGEGASNQTPARLRRAPPLERGLFVPSRLRVRLCFSDP